MGGGDSSKSKGIKGRGDVKFNEATELKMFRIDIDGCRVQL